MPRFSNASSTSPLPRRAAIATADLPSDQVYERRVGAVVQHQLDVLEPVVAPQGLMERRMMPARHPIRIGSFLEQESNAFRVVPVGLAKQHRREAVLGELAALDQDAHRGVVVGLRRVIHDLVVVGVRPALEEEPGQLRVVRDSGGAVERALPFGLGLVIGLVPSRIRARAGVEQGLRRSHEPVRSRPVEAQVSGEAEVRERVPAARALFRRGIHRDRARGTGERPLRRRESPPCGCRSPAISGCAARIASAPSSVPLACPPSSGTHAASMKSVRGSSVFVALIDPFARDYCPQSRVRNQSHSVNPE